MAVPRVPALVFQYPESNRIPYIQNRRGTVNYLGVVSLTYLRPSGRGQVTWSLKTEKRIRKREGKDNLFKMSLHYNSSSPSPTSLAGGDHFLMSDYLSWLLSSVSFVLSLIVLFYYILYMSVHLLAITYAYVRRGEGGREDFCTKLRLTF